jgi:hypothetical protein
VEDAARAVVQHVDALAVAHVSQVEAADDVGADGLNLRIPSITDVVGATLHVAVHVSARACV